MRNTTNRGCVMAPTQRSVAVRQLNRSFECGQRDVTFLIARMIRIFPRNAVKHRGMFNAEMNILRCIP